MSPSRNVIESQFQQISSADEDTMEQSVEDLAHEVASKVPSSGMSSYRIHCLSDGLVLDHVKGGGHVIKKEFRPKLLLVI